MAETPEGMYAIATLMAILALLAVGLRFFARHIKRSGFSWDDYTILPALVRFRRIAMMPADMLIVDIGLYCCYSYLHVHW